MALNHEQGGGVDEETGEVYDSSNYNFIQIYTDSMGFIEDIIDENSMSAWVLLVLIKAMKSGTNIAEVTQKDLSAYFGCTERHVQKAIKVLVNRRAMRINKVGNNNAYQINTKVAWTARASGKANKTLFTEELLLKEENGGQPKLRTQTVKRSYTDKNR